MVLEQATEVSVVVCFCQLFKGLISLSVRFFFLKIFEETLQKALSKGYPFLKMTEQHCENPEAAGK